MRYHNITKDDMLNGDGLRVVLWVAGCNHCCRDCQNPKSHRLIIVIYIVTTIMRFKEKVNRLFRILGGKTWDM